MLKSKKLLKITAILASALSLGVVAFWSALGSVWTQWDFQIIGLFQQEAVKRGYGPEVSSKIVFLHITDETKKYYGETLLDRKVYAEINDALTELGAEAVVYDMMFERQRTPDSDQLFKESIKKNGRVYLPIGLDLLDPRRPFDVGERENYERLRNKRLQSPIEKGDAQPIHGAPSFMQLDDFFEEAFNTGFINVKSDADGVHRHMPMLLKVESDYLPSLGLSVFLDYAEVPLAKVVVDWGNEIRIPAAKDGPSGRETIIPIDSSGQAFIPYAQFWEAAENNFGHMQVHTFLELFADPDSHDGLREFFEGKFVFIGEVSHASGDIGQTPLEDRVPKIALHVSILNGLLTGSFYRERSSRYLIGLIILIGVILGVSALPKATWVLYFSGAGIVAGLIGWTWFDFIHFKVFPIVAAGGGTLFIFFGLVGGLQVAIARDQAFIRNAFSKYVPKKVVNALLDRPELLQLGGEERVLTVLFSDIEGFTTVSETMKPRDLVLLLNEYLTEMTGIILAEGGIIDKFEGDLIMAEFGAPVPMDAHADQAVSTGLKMQKRLEELRRMWKQKGLPQLKCRVGINTGLMVVGNMGSDQVFDYTVMGDSVNLASRLEGANKRYGTYLMISEFTRNHLTPGLFKTRVLDVIRVKGKTKAVKVYEVYAETSATKGPAGSDYYQTYEDAFEAYLSRNFTASREKFLKALSLREDDLASRQMIERIDGLNPETLPADWNGSVGLTEK